MSAAPVPISLADYMNTDYEPDCDYVDGFLEERNVGKDKHSRTQMILGGWLFSMESRGHFKAHPEQRVQVSPRRVRIPDLCLVDRDDHDEVKQRPPLLWIEILSPEDRWNRVQIRLNDALRFGVQTIWVIDPYAREAWLALPGLGTVQVEDGILRCKDPELQVRLDEILPPE